jgi:hypothetical protein
MGVNEAGLWGRCCAHLPHENDLWLMNSKRGNDFSVAARKLRAVDKVSAGL